MKLCFFVLIMSLTVLGRLAAPPQANKPLGKGQVMELVKAGMESEELSTKIAELGIDFEPTDDYLQALRKAGAQDAVIKALRAARPKPLTREQVLQLVAGHVPNQRAATLVKQRGIDFLIDDDYLQTLRVAGADDAVIAAVRGASAAARAELVVTTSPNAEVYLDGDLQGRAGAQGELTVNKVKPGTHVLKVSLPGKKDFEQSITVAGGVVNKLAAALNDLPGRIVVSAPAGAEVFLDGASRGKSDASNKLVLADVLPGSHRVRVTAQGKKDYEQDVSVSAGEERVVRAMLLALPGSLRIRTNPGAVVFLDNGGVGTADPNGELVKADVSPGSYTLRIAAKDKQESRREVRIVAGEETKVEAMLADLEKPSGESLALMVGLMGGLGKRLEGLYQSESVEGAFAQARHLLRFYTDGTVIGAAVAGGASAEINAWFHKGYEDSGTYQIQGSTIRFSLTSKDGTVDYSGKMQKDTLTLDSLSHINGHRGHDRYHLVKE
ncbi:MAG: PEGA domain-containing protein [Terriglobia bacterium]|jgi:hypothetical protein